MTEPQGLDHPHFIVTVDTETFTVKGSPPAFGTNIYGELPEGTLGVQRIMDICGRYDVKATFFVDVYMHHYYGKAPVRELCGHIVRNGHDVQLHAHTSWIPNGDFQHLSAFPLQKQVEIIAEGKELIREWTGKAPVAFRAGAYAANLDTIQALEQNGFILDSSYLAFHENCELSRQLSNHPANQIFKIGGILEVPVTMYWLFDNVLLRKMSKLDINACSLTELRNVIPKLVRGRIRCVILFLHSFSFIRWKKDYSGVLPNYRALERFERTLEMICGWGYRGSFCTMAELSKALSGDQDGRCDLIPTVNSLGIILRALRRILE